MPHDVFISYSHLDQTIADSVCACLERAGMACWIAHRDIRPGDDWPKAIPPAIEAARIVVLIFSMRANESDYVVREVTLAADAKKPLIPFRIENVTPSGSMKFFLCRPNWLEAHTPPLEGHIQTLVRTTASLLGRDVSAEPHEPRLIETRAGVRVETVPPGASVSLGGMALPNRTPCTFLVDLEADQAREIEAVIRMPGYRTALYSVTLTRDALVQIRATMDPVAPKPPAPACMPSAPEAPTAPPSSVDDGEKGWTHDLDKVELALTAVGFPFSLPIYAVSSIAKWVNAKKGGDS